MIDDRFSLPSLEPGWVWLAGAGPGDPGLLTLYAVRGLEQADVIIYDALVSQEVLSLAAEGTALEYAGKRGGKPSPKQANISHRLIQFAREGKRVLRLKGGDPLIFGRGAEEAMALVEAGVDFRIIPGVSAGVGGLAYAGIPLTHRDTNSSVTFVTGHNASGVVPDSVDWSAVAKGSNVIVVYMPLKHLANISAKLIAGGRDREEPVAVISKATTSEQRVLETTLGRCAVEAERDGLEPPAMFVVGEVVRLRASLDWLGALAGKRLIANPLGSSTLPETG
ncbi:MAG: uroporphyrinogen-III C-methyltransferase [Alphaproteobacteria bacterium]|jgi:uroporphyrin-III C-methyltransferase|nr:uroporphyrinogen-III C-methyltransferase [Alphaproteobacteria bacterium]